MNAWTAWGLATTALCVAVGVACYVTSSGLPLFALIFIPSLTTGKGCKCEKPHDGDGDRGK